MGGRGTNGNRNSQVQQSGTILESEVRATPLYSSLTANGVKTTFASSLTRAVMRHPESGSMSQENYEFYNLNGRQFNSQIQMMKKQLEKQGYEVTVSTVDRSSGGEYRLKRGYGFQKTSVQHYTVKEISWRKR